MDLPGSWSIGEQKTLVAAIQCFETLPKVTSCLSPFHPDGILTRSYQVDYEKLAKLMGWTVGSAKSNWSRTKTKLLAGISADAEASASVTRQEMAKKRKATDEVRVSSISHDAQ